MLPLLLLPTQKPRSGVRRGAPAEPRRVSQNPESESDGTWQVHMVPDQIQDPRSGVTEVSRPGAPKVQDSDSGRRPVALPQSDAQKPESRVRRAPQGPRREGPTRRIQSPASGGAPEAAEGRQGPRIQGQALRGGGGEGQDPEGQGGGARTPGLISTNENP